MIPVNAGDARFTAVPQQLECCTSSTLGMCMDGRFDTQVEGTREVLLQRVAWSPWHV